ncbi:MAG: hypothetical protein OXC03_04635 [Flavobacteriaceae bacterium]|nr:hypothetical protein [Flavobacteriaceae bacterium]
MWHFEIEIIKQPIHPDNPKLKLPEIENALPLYFPSKPLIDGPEVINQEV